VQKIERVFRAAQVGREIGKEHFHVLQSSSSRNARIARHVRNKVPDLLV
jgi:hypothetical protein